MTSSWVVDFLVQGRHGASAFFSKLPLPSGPRILMGLTWKGYRWWPQRRSLLGKSSRHFAHASPTDFMQSQHNFSRGFAFSADRMPASPVTSAHVTVLRCIAGWKENAFLTLCLQNAVHPQQWDVPITTSVTSTP